ncbi:histone-like nucleoid-structuring protein, MvaT/MvaU family [Pseudomonas nitroreducens]|uniref:histone-like nucleoid-structuring protein, MvaT/MvaU family n=1 Tax=Pseudomonas nitroreducens TaxID=46680 RepID=UPI003D04BB02
MSKLAEFKRLEAQLAEQLRQLDAMKNDNGLKKEIEFEEKLRALMAEYGVSVNGIRAILDPESTGRSTAGESGKQRRQRAVKVYKNPETGEVVETKGGNHKVLKAWKEQFGGDVVEGWLQA